MTMTEGNTDTLQWFRSARDVRPVESVPFEAIAAATSGNGQNSKLASELGKASQPLVKAREACEAEWGDDWVRAVKTKRTHALAQAWVKAKTALPAVVFGARFGSKRASEDVAELTHLVALDIDEVSAQQINDLRSKVISGDYGFVRLLYLSPSRAGCRLVLRVRSERSSELDDITDSNLLAEFYTQHFWRPTAAWCAETLEVEPDEGAKDAARLSFLAIDEDCYFSPSSADEALNVDDWIEAADSRYPYQIAPTADEATRKWRGNRKSEWKDGAAARALEYCDPNAEHKDWVRLVFAAFDAGATVADVASWSGKSGKYDKQAAFQIKQMSKGRKGRVTAGTLYHQARAGGMPEAELADLTTGGGGGAPPPAPINVKEVLDDELDVVLGETDSAASDEAEIAAESQPPQSSKNGKLIRNTDLEGKKHRMTPPKNDDHDDDEMEIEETGDDSQVLSAIGELKTAMTDLPAQIAAALTGAMGSPQSNGVADDETQVEVPKQKAAPKKPVAKKQPTKKSPPEKSAAKKSAAPKRKAAAAAGNGDSAYIGTDGHAPRHTIEDRPDVRQILTVDEDNEDAPTTVPSVGLPTAIYIDSDYAPFRPNYESPCLMIPTGFLVASRYQDDSPTWKAAVDFVYIREDGEVRFVPAVPMGWGHDSGVAAVLQNLTVSRKWEENKQRTDFEPSWWSQKLEHPDSSAMKKLKRWASEHLETWGEMEREDGKMRHYKQVKLATLEAAYAEHVEMVDMRGAVADLPDEGEEIDDVLDDIDIDSDEDEEAAAEAAVDEIEDDEEPF